jgi:hypothetical protein
MWIFHIAINEPPEPPRRIPDLLLEGEPGCAPRLALMR